MGAIAVVGVCLALALAPTGAGPAATRLPASDSLADGDGAPVSAASSYRPESLAKFSDVMHIEDGEGNLLALDDVPAGDYSGFLFKVADASAGAGDVSGKLAEAEQAGIVRNVHDDLYATASV